MARKYEVFVCPDCGAGVRIEPTEGGTEGVCLSCGWSERGDFDHRRDIRKPLSVTAIDERDVEPLIEAARALREAVTVEDVEDAEALILKAFEPFEAEEDSGG